MTHPHGTQFTRAAPTKRRVTFEINGLLFEVGRGETYPIEYVEGDQLPDVKIIVRSGPDEDLTSTTWNLRLDRNATAEADELLRSGGLTGSESGVFAEVLFQWSSTDLAEGVGQRCTIEYIKTGESEVVADFLINVLPAVS